MILKGFLNYPYTDFWAKLCLTFSAIQRTRNGTDLPI